MEYKLSKECAHDLESIWIYTFQNWSAEQADRYLNLIFDEIDYLCLHPESGIDFGYIREGYFRSKVKSHFIFYKINSKNHRLEIIRVLHEMTDIEYHLIKH